MTANAGARPWWDRFFVPNTDPAAAMAFLAFAGIVLLCLGRVELALATAWASVILEIGLRATGKVRLRVPLALVVALYGSGLILVLGVIKGP